MRWRPRDAPIAGATAAALLLIACGSPRPARAPSSIVLVTIDTLRADHVNAQLTPTLDALAREAVVFDQAITVGPLTLPAHASLLTAQFPTHHTVHDNQIYALPETVVDLPIDPQTARLRDRCVRQRRRSRSPLRAQSRV